MVLKSLFASDISGRIKFKLRRLAIEWELLYNLHFSKFLKTQLSLKEFEMHGYSICFCWYLKKTRKIIIIESLIKLSFLGTESFSTT